MLIFQGVFVSGGDKLAALGFGQIISPRGFYGSYTPFQSSQPHCICSLNISGFAMICLSASALLGSEHIGVNVD